MIARALESRSLPGPQRRQVCGLDGERPSGEAPWARIAAAVLMVTLQVAGRHSLRRRGAPARSSSSLRPPVTATYPALRFAEPFAVAPLFLCSGSGLFPEGTLDVYEAQNAVRPIRRLGSWVFLPRGPGEPPTDQAQSVSSTQAAVVVTPPGVLAGNSNYWITAADPNGSTGLPITGFNVSIAVREDLHIPNGVSIQLNGWSAPSSGR